MHPTPKAQHHVDILRGNLARAVDAEIAARESTFGGAVIIEQNDAVTLKAGYGWANRGRGIAFTPATIAQVGSLTKQFTATAIAALAQVGKLGFDDPLGAHIPRVPAGAAGITIHQLLTHSSGLPCAAGDDFDRVSRDMLLTEELAHPERPPDSDYAYSNLGYSVLAAVVEIVSGMTLEAFLDARLFKPLGMTSTGTLFTPAHRDELAWGYADDRPLAPISDRIRHLVPDYWHLKGNGGMQASAEDLYTWYRALSRGPIVTDAMRQALFAPHARYDEGVAYGYGWFVRHGADGKLLQVSHTGSDGIFYAAFMWRPEDRAFAYLVTSSGEEVGARIAGSIRCTITSER